MSAQRDLLIFVHIPKTAGTSFRALAEPQFPPEAFLHLDPPITLEKHRALLPRLPAIRALFGHLYFVIDANLGLHGDYVTFLRDPIARVASYWKHQCKYANSTYFGEVRRGLTLEALLRSGREIQLDNLMTRVLVGNSLPGMLDGTVPHLEGTEPLEAALENVRERFIFVGFAEAFERSVQSLFERLGWAMPTELPFLNRLGSRVDGLDARTLRQIESCNRLDALLYRRLREESPHFR
jgi:hypothetical protein